MVIWVFIVFFLLLKIFLYYFCCDYYYVCSFGMIVLIVFFIIFGVLYIDFKKFIILLSGKLIGLLIDIEIIRVFFVNFFIILICFLIVVLI